MDIWVGGILETNDGPGELFQSIISDQFQRIRDGDRFWYKNFDNKYAIIPLYYISLYIFCTIDSTNSRYDFVSRLFTYEEIRRLEQLSFYDMLMCITKMEWNDIPRNPFRVPTTGKGETICGNVNLFNSS